MEVFVPHGIPTRCSQGDEWQHSLSLLEAVQGANLKGSVVTYNACISFLTADGRRESRSGAVSPKVMLNTMNL